MLSHRLKPRHFSPRPSPMVKTRPNRTAFSAHFSVLIAHSKMWDGSPWHHTPLYGELYFGIFYCNKIPRLCGPLSVEQNFPKVFSEQLHLLPALVILIRIFLALPFRRDGALGTYTFPPKNSGIL